MTLQAISREEQGAATHVEAACAKPGAGLAFCGRGTGSPKEEMPAHQVLSLLITYPSGTALRASGQLQQDGPGETYPRTPYQHVPDLSRVRTDCSALWSVACRFSTARTLLTKIRRVLSGISPAKHDMLPEYHHFRG